MKPTFILLNKYLPFVFSVPPLDLRVETKQNTVSLKLIDFGEVVKVGERDAVRISFSSFFPSLKSPFYKPYLNPLTPVLCVDELQAWKDAKTKLKLIIPEFNISYTCQIENFTHSYEERTGDIQYQISLVEFRDPKKLDKNIGLLERW